MADITMCVNSECVAKYYCYRHRAIPSDRQSVSRFTPSNNISGEKFKCDDWVEYYKQEGK
jgi:hypothetical protein